MSATACIASTTTPESTNENNHLIDCSDRSNTMGANNPHQRRESKLLLEGVEYDLSNLLSGTGTSSKDDMDDDLSCASSSTSDNSEGYLTCQSRCSSFSRGTMSRNISNASSVFDNNTDNVFEQQTKAARRQSPYRFDMEAMRTLMTSFRGIPELQNSFRLSKCGSVRHIHDESEFPSNREEEDDLLLGKSFANDEEDDNDDLLLLGNNNRKSTSTKKASDEDAAARSSVSTVSTADSTVCGGNNSFNSSECNTPPSVPEEDEEAEDELDSIKPSTSPSDAQEQLHMSVDSAIADLVYDEATGTYVYKEEYLFEEEEQAALEPPTLEEQDPLAQSGSQYHDACQTTQEASNRYTLEEMAASAECDDGEFDDDEHEMEISPGVYVPFRGAKETWHAVATHCTVELQCLDCFTTLVCINDCEFTVCPDCRVVNPVFCDDPIGKPFGVGMGFKKEWVLKKQMLQREKERITMEQEDETAELTRSPLRGSMAASRRRMAHIHR